MDGTLLNKEDKVSESTKEAVRRLNEAGVKTVICTGRVVTSIEYANEVIGIDNPAIGNNGAIIKLNKDKILATHPLEDEHLLELIDFCEEHKFIYHFYDQDTFYSNRLVDRSLHHLAIDNDYGLNYQVNISISKDPYKTMKDKGHDGLKILIGSLGSHPYGEEKARELITETFKDKLYVTSSGPGSMEIMEPHVNKWEGIKELIDFLGINEDETAAIGDSFNDLPMIENAKLSFAMGNGNDTIKSVANHIVGDNNGTGIADAADIILNFNKENPSV